MRHFVDSSLQDSNFTTSDILNFLYTGPEEWREAGMASFDWRNLFNVADQLLRTLNQYGEVRTIRGRGRGSRLIAAFQTFPGCAAGEPWVGASSRPFQTGASVFQVCSPELCNKAPF